MLVCIGVRGALAFANLAQACAPLIRPFKRSDSEFVVRRPSLSHGSRMDGDAALLLAMAQFRPVEARSSGGEGKSRSTPSLRQGRHRADRDAPCRRPQTPQRPRAPPTPRFVFAFLVCLMCLDGFVASRQSPVRTVILFCFNFVSALKYHKHVCSLGFSWLLA